MVYCLAIGPVHGIHSRSRRRSDGQDELGCARNDLMFTAECHEQRLLGGASISNTTNLYLDEQCFVTWKNGGTVSGTPIITIYAAGSTDGGTTYSDGATGGNASQTPTNPVNYKILAVGNVPVASTQ